jgi:hypothetical protein
MAHYSSRINMIVLASLALVLGVLGESLNYRAKEDPPELLGNLCPKTELEYSLQTNVCGAPPLAFPDPREDYSPWTARPMCINVDTAKPGASPHIEPFCTYTNANFADGRGISFFTSQSIMDDVVKSPPFTEPESIKGMNDLINPPWGPPPYESRWFPGKGIGLVANRTIVRGERIMQETPSFVFNRAIFSQTDEENRLPMQWNAVYQLPKHTREELLALHKHHGGDEIDDLMRTNAFGAYYGEDDLHNNILPRISRFNHDCRPKSV